VDLELIWEGDQRFRGRSGGVELTLDGNAQAGASPVQALAFALAACMAIDVVHILTKGRHQPRTMRARLRADRAPTDPRRIIAARLHFRLTGKTPPEKVERAIALSREKYCSVWHSLRPDIAFETSFEVAQGPGVGSSGATSRT
jgi:putative redox protein